MSSLQGALYGEYGGAPFLGQVGRHHPAHLLAHLPRLRLQPYVEGVVGVRDYALGAPLTAQVGRPPREGREGGQLVAPDGVLHPHRALLLAGQQQAPEGLAALSVVIEVEVLVAARLEVAVGGKGLELEPGQLEGVSILALELPGGPTPSSFDASTGPI